MLRKLHSIEFGRKKAGIRPGLSQAALADLLRLLLMLLENGLTLPKRSASLAADRSTKKYRHVLEALADDNRGRRIAQPVRWKDIRGHSTPMQVQQIRIGERSGALEKALARVCEQMERQVALRKRIIKKTSYPILITVAGTGLMVFMCVVVVPEFETVYTPAAVSTCQR